MFGGNSAWGQNNQNNQQQQGGGLFGGGATTGGFGQPQQQANTGFGQSTGGFGQPAQQNQGGGLFGSTAATQNTGFGGGGGFGAAPQQNQTSTFGAARPAFGATGSTFGASNTGGGLFGSNNTSTTSTFGAANTQNSGGLFGRPSAAPSSTFGTGATSNLFGARPATTGTFGSAPQQANVNAVNPYRDGPYPPPPATGSQEPAYYPTWQQDPSTSTTSSAPPPHLFHSIASMDPYKGASPEELRAMDYQQGRKHPTQGAPAASGGFGAASGSTGGFGQPAQTNTFGQPASTNTFGAPKPAGSLFGSTTGTTGFGSTSTGGFGQPSSGALFGQTQQQPQTTGFGQTNTTGGGLFGQPTQASTTGGGLFGATSNTFGQPQTQPAPGTSTFGGFGAAKPAFGAPASTPFGQQNTAQTGGFGQPAPAAGSTGFGGFGQTQQPQQQPAAGGGLFGSGGFGSTTQSATGGGLFGQPAQQQNQPAGGGLFGSTAAKPGGLFGSTAAPAATGTSTFGGFGQTNTQQPAATGGLFGNNAAAPSTGGLFGQPQQQNTQQPAAGGGLFGNTSTGGLFGAKPATTGTTGGGLFGAAQPAQTQPAQTNSLFGGTGQTSSLFGGQNNSLGLQNQQQNQAKPAGGLFGGGSLFGNNNSTQAAPLGNTGGGLFGGGLSQSQPASTGLFGGQTQQPQQGGLGGSLFGGGLGQSTMNQGQQQQQQMQQPTLTASIDQNPYGRNELFVYSGQKLELGSQTKKPALPPLTASSFRITPSSKSQLNKLRGFASPLTASQSPARPGSPSLSASARGGYLNSPSSDRYKGLTETALSPNAFVPRPSIKKLTLTPKSNGLSNGDIDSVLGKSALKSTTPAPNQATPRSNGGAAASPGSLLFNAPAANGKTNGNSSDETPSRQAEAPSQAATNRVAGSERQPKKGEYWCKPKLEKLRHLGKRDLAELHNFTAGRRGFGEVTFLEPVDLTEVDLSDFLGTVIVFSEMELAVYPDDNSPNKPERGSGLNVPAQISLENCFTKDKATKQPITDTSDPRHLKFLKRVKSIPDTDFVSYTDDGVWTFKVEHFSRYGLNGSDDESDGASPAAKKATPLPSKKRAAHQHSGLERTPSQTPSDDDDDFLPPTRGLHDMHDDESGTDEDGNEGTSLTDGEMTRDDEDQDREDEYSHPSDGDEDATYSHDDANFNDPMQYKLGAAGMRKLREMQSSLFAADPSTNLTKRGYGNTGNTKAVERTKSILDTRATREQEDFKFAEEGDTPLETRASKRASFGIPTSPPKMRQPRKYSKVELQNSSAKGTEGLRADAGLALGRSFRCSWGPNGELVHFGKICPPTSTFSPSSSATVTIDTIGLVAGTEKVEVMKAERLLSLQLTNTNIALLDGVPQATTSPHSRFHHYTRLFDAGDRSHEASVFRLGHALFDEIDLGLPPDSPEELVERIMQVRRKLALSRWLEDAVAPSVDSDLLAHGDNRAAAIFTLLSGNKLDRAVQTAIEGNNLRLATLISQIGGPETLKEEVMKQLEDWQKYKSNSLISTEYRRLYALLAGITDVAPGDKSSGSDATPDVLIAEGLDWKRAFGLKLWFGTPFEDPISQVFESYTQGLDSSHPPAQPLPPHLEKPGDERVWKMPAVSTPNDVLYNMIRIFSDVTSPLERTLAPRTTSSSPTDFRLSWHLYILLAKVLAKRDFEDRTVSDISEASPGYSALADSFTQSYAAQLEQLGLWTYSAFILLHLETARGRETALKALLHRHPDPVSQDVTFLTETLLIPMTWIYAAQAAQLASESDAWGEYFALIRAEQYIPAQRILCEKLALEAVIRDDMALLRRLCEPLQGKPDGWEYNGKLFVDYADLKEKVRPLLESILQAGRLGSAASPYAHAELVSLSKTLTRTLKLLPALLKRKDDLQQVVCLSEMLSVLHELAGVLHKGRYMENVGVGAGLVDVDRLHLLQSNAFEGVERSLEAAVAV